MNRLTITAFIAGGILLIGFLGYEVIGKQQSTSNNDSDASIATRGTSVVVLVDFSKSFPASYRSDGSISYGLRFEDRRALSTLASSLAELASRYWTPPLKTIWNRIQASSISASPLCAPLETIQKLVKPEGSIGTREEIQAVLQNCVSTVVEASKDKNLLGDYTYISGAVAMASEVASSEYNERVLIILSDMHEELPPGTSEASFKLNGERVVILHRPGTDEPQNISGYISRINDWKKKLTEHGAKTVVTVPVFAVSGAQLRQALKPEDTDAGTSLTVLVDFKENVFPTSQTNSFNRNILENIGKTLAELARDWPLPVTALWVAVGSSGFTSKTLPPVEFNPSLIKKEHTLNTVEEFSKAMEEMGRALPSRGRGIASTDISGTLGLSCSIDPLPKSQVLVVISDFVDSGPQPPASFRLSPGTRVVMIHKASPTDRTDPNSFGARRHIWEQRFKESGASAVYQFPLLSFTPNDLRSCLGVSK